MPRQLESPQDLLLREQETAVQQARIAEIDEELTLYHPDGPWRFFEKHLRLAEETALNALVQCPKDQIDWHRGRLQLVRYLAGIPGDLRDERARLTEQSNE